jgi:AcrR family transcriptional regulator
MKIAKARGRTKSEEKRQLMLDAATSLFIEFGYSGTSMEQIAEIAGVSKQTLYSHFGGKEGLFVAAIECRCIHYELSEAFFEDERPIEDVLYELCLHFTDLLLSEEGIRVHRLCCAEAEQYPEVSRLFYEAGPQHLIDILAQYLGRQNDCGVVNIESPYFAASQLLFMVKGEAQMRALLNCNHAGVSQNLPAYLKSCVDLFMRAYANKD